MSVAQGLEIPDYKAMTVNVLRAKLNEGKAQKPQDEPNTRQLKVRTLEINVDLKYPAALVKSGTDLLFVSDLASSRILELGIEKKHSCTLDSFELVGTCLSVMEVDNLTCYSLACKANCLFMADHNRGILRVDLSSRETSAIAKAGSDNCSQPHGIAVFENNIAFTDIDKKEYVQLKMGM